MGFIYRMMEYVEEILMSVFVWVVSVVCMVCAPIFWLFGCKVEVGITLRGGEKKE